MIQRLVPQEKFNWVPPSNELIKDSHYRGLAIAQSLVRRKRGKISATSSGHNQGTTVTFSMKMPESYV